ncbi:ATP-binding protein [Viridibacterium curvum]|uniref:histidine kinase n=1 Tax=Viridibacterium curvum TaxID=1101404 RepID=A0ABP9QT61_9RHOO
MLKLGLGKYRKIVVLIALFLVFDVGVLGMTFLISNQIAADAVSLNLAGEQRTLVQQMTKSALLLQDDATQGTIDSTGKSSFSELDELLLTADRFNATLEAFHEGGKVLENGAKVALTPQDDVQAGAFFAQLEALWLPVNAELQKLKAQKSKNPDLGPVLQILVADNLNLLSISNMLTNRMEVISASRAQNLRIIQIAGITLALVNFAFILYSFLGQLRKSDAAVEVAQRETENILRTTQDGLFLLDTSFTIGTQTSQALGRILGVPDVAGKNFLDLIRPMVTPKTFDTTQEYIELLMRHDVKEKLVASLNPLDCLEINTPRPNGAIDTRYLNFSFNRVTHQGKVTHLLVTANDITRRVRLERELKESERKVQDQMGMMVHLLQADPRLLQDFLRSAVQGLDEINVALKNASGEGFTRAIEQIFRIAHRMKGDANALKLEALGDALHAFETVLSDLQQRKSGSNEDLLPVTVRVKSLYVQLHAIQDTLARIVQVRGVVQVEPPKPAHDPEIANLPFVRQWKGFVQQVAERNGKHAELSYQGMDLDKLDAPLREALNSIVNQFIRNAVTHGVEKPAERRLRGKPEAGRLSVYVSDQGDGMVELSFRDDGAGINHESLRAVAVRSGRMTAEAAAAAEPRALVSLIFEPGVSTRETADEDAGRGVGLDSVKAMIARMGGRVRIGTTAGEYCHFRVQLPLHTMQQSVQTEEVREAA